MELELSLGDSPAPAKGTSTPVLTPTHAGKEDHELVLELGVGTAKRTEQDNQKTPTHPGEDAQDQEDDGEACFRSELSLSCQPLPASAETGSANSEECRRGFEVNTVLVDGDTVQGRSLSTSSLPMEVPVRQAADQEAAEDEENTGVGGGARKKLRLSKEQSAFLEDSFKEHSTLTPKQKSDLAKKLNLRPRQVEVWFQNRRARTKLKQTEVDREYLKRCCETLAQENRRLHREVAELRALRTAPYPFYGHLPAAGFSTARVCPSCDDKVTPHNPAITASSPPVSTLFARPHFGAFTVHPVLRRQPSATS
ncbi:homeobox-leucine zipper protein HOX7-like [Panicum miliaceum]|uniref:Homeobox-leucine zipper protein HOX7-like n=1 Tax=Panicum miliaceum TaxID=4540 RepID=A0A3L6RNY4_PANMI|nr:homeobox-leucine zipper protein HOX7-like [Panicum miliaceum]